ncbi:MAG: hypothetical protein WD646_05260 [Actinomycetota bacterium]
MPTVLVIGEHTGARDALELMLLDQISMKWTTTPDETEGLDVDVVVIGPGLSDLNAVRVHPVLRDVPVVVLGGLAGGDHLRTRDAWAVATGRPTALDELTDLVQMLVARATHPSCHRAHETTPAA